MLRAFQMEPLISDDLSLARLGALARDSRRAIAVGMAVSFLAVLTYLHVAEYRYAINLQLTPVESDMQTPSSLSSLASAAGLAGNLNSPNWNLYNAALQSSMASAGIMANPKLMHLIFYNQWTGSGWRNSGGGMLHPVKDAIYFVLDMPASPPSPPAIDDVQTFLEKRISITPDRKTSTIDLELDWPDPEAGKTILAGVSGIVDDLVRSRDFVRAQNYSAYAAGELQKASMIEYREALAQLLMQQERRKMIASAKLPFAAQPLGQPLSSSRPTSPPAIALAILSLPFGAFLGILATFFFRRFRS